MRAPTSRSRRPRASGHFGGGTFEFEDERATTYELGVKTALGGTAEVNADVFYTDYKDLQTSAFDGAIGFNVGNGSAEVKGVEVSRAAGARCRRFTLSGSVAYLDFEWTKYIGQCYFGCRCARRRAPTATTTASPTSWHRSSPAWPRGDYRWDVGGNLELNAVLDVVYSSKFLQSLTLDPADTQDAYAKLNARLSAGRRRRPLGTGAGGHATSPTRPR